MSQNNVDFAAYYNQYLDGLKVKVKNAVRQALHDTWSDFFSVVEGKIRIIFNDAIQDFYSGFSPQYYDRNESLYNILQTDRSEDALSIWFDPSRMTPFRSGYDGEDGLYDQVFRHGWHGGAGSGDGHPSPGTPYWRKPVPYYSHWGHDAPIAAVSPLDDIKRRVADYERNEMQSDFNRLWSVHAGNIKIDS